MFCERTRSATARPDSVSRKPVVYGEPVPEYTAIALFVSNAFSIHTYADMRRPLTWKPFDSLKSNDCVAGDVRSFSAPVGCWATFSCVTSSVMFVPVYGVPVATLYSTFRSTSARGVELRHFGPSPFRKPSAKFTVTRWRWSKSSGEVWCGTWLAVHAMLRCVFDTEPVPCANDRL